MAEQSADRQAWHAPGYLDTRAGHLTVDGIDVIELAEEHGTPLYVFSEKRIVENIRNLRRAVESVHSRVKLCYASKANSNMAVLAAVLRAGGDIEVNSGGELFKARKVGFRPDQIVFNGVSKTDQEIRDAVDYGILAINVDSLYEIDQVARVARSAGKRANVAIRIVPEIVTRSHIGLQTGLLSSKFGLSPSQVEEAFALALAAPDAINLAGVHIHVGSQTPDPQPFARAFAEMWLFLVGLYKKTGHRLTHINIGGGLPVDYLPETSMAEEIGERERAMLSAELDPTGVLKAAFEEAIPQDQAELFEGLTIVLEPGRRISGDTGLLLTRVCNIKERPETGDTWLLTDAGYSLMLSINTYKWYYHLVSASRAKESHATPYKVAGPLCDSGDVYFDIERGTRLPNYRLLPEGTGVGDLLALLNTGAYALDQASQYNGRPIPAAVMITESGEVRVARRRETYEDLYKMDLW
ncbi:MAG TPA: diaminopimelate decarboxylase [Blastocatellia bacterium]|jgi:diaminopimelate decarboxylase|nr:diaminopimelate decarboxylase [Blastocatellia bacterium]